MCCKEGIQKCAGLFINRFVGNGIQIQSSSNVVARCFIGTSPDGTAKLPNGGAGVAIISSRSNRVGGTDLSDRNILSGNDHGIWIGGNTATGNVVQGNFIGTDITGTISLGNANNGILLGAPRNTIGGTSAAARNIISGNGQNGIHLNDAFASNNWVYGNFIGTKANGAGALSNTLDGIKIFRAARNFIGGAIPGAGNVISGNGERGVYIYAIAGMASQNRIEGNLIGTDLTGRTNLGNRYSGVGISFAQNTVVGGSDVLARNIISGNGQSGVFIESNSVASVISGNFIGLDATGTSVLPNSFSGISVTGGTNNVIGGTTPGTANIISGNLQSGVRLSGGTLTLVQGNLIGVDFTGHLSRGNAADGVRIECSSNVVGGDRLIGRNVISGNAQAGVSMLNAAASNNVVSGNLIGPDVSGAVALGNHSGVAISGAPRNVIGTAAPLGGNIISGNRNSGIDVLGASSTGNRILGNRIGTDSDGVIALPNLNPGIYLGGAANFIGGSEPGEGNLISGNFNAGIFIRDSGANGNVILGNYIGTGADGASPLPNSFHGIDIQSPASSTIVGGTAPGAGNRIAYAAGAGYDGVRVRDDCVGNIIRGNTFFGNNELAIDLGINGVTANDNNDPDNGANNLQNSPVLLSAAGRYITTINGTLNSRPNAAFTVDFYGSDSLVGQGGRHLGSAAINTIGNNTTFSIVLTNAVSVGGFVSATVTDSAGNTSEFSTGTAVPPAPDADLDGLPNDYEIAFGLNPNSNSDGMAYDLDSDGDGASNYQEFLAGTKPNDPASVFRFSMQRQSERTLIFVESVAGLIYRVDGSEDLNGPWTMLSTGLAGTGSRLRIIDTTGATQKFYRVRGN